MRSLLLLPVAALFSSAPPSNVVEVVGTDYAFTVPATVAAGRTTFVFKNAGKHGHEFNIFLLKKGSTIDQFLELRRANKPQMGVVVEAPVGVLFADPGTTAGAKLTTNLLPGREYGIICIFRDTTAAPRHYDMGMYKVISTSARAARPAAKESVDSIIGVDYAYSKYPREISPGVHTLVFRNAGKHRHEINITLLKQGVTLDSLVAVDKRGGDVNALFDLTGPSGVLYSDAGTAPLGGLTMEFLPGREYAFECGFQDDDKSPEHYKLGMYASIKVKKR
jgi:uncharacterized cupredoxin-like copper-binding protein